MSSYRPLNVKDALSYLDQVKVQFSDQPEVYNRFLDIMKDFKSQTIDTPGVIDRVSTLFKGHPSLIQGFNTFLPPGYHIECSNNPHEPNTIRVTTPSGTTSTSTGGPTDGHLAPATASSGTTSATASGYYPATPNYSHVSSGPSMMPTLQPHPQGSQLTQQAVPYHIAGNPPLPIGPPQNQQQQGKRAPVEFNHAINYVNKIKNRFSTEPDTYKQFLEILQTYQKEQKPIQDVYAQVQVLFKNAPDLLDEFKQFLPDTSGNVPSGGLFGQNHGHTQKPHMMPVLQSMSNGIAGIGRLPPVGNFAPSPSAPANSEPYKKSIISGGSTVGGSGQSVVGASTTNKKKRAVPGPERNTISGSPGKSKKSKLQHRPDFVQSSLTLSPHKTEQSKQQLRQAATSDELMFFDKVKKYLGNKANHSEFLKVIALYSQRILDAHLVVERMRTFIGTNPELFEWFKQFIKYEDRDEIVQNTAVARPRLDLDGCKAFGPSYRQLPKSEQSLPCSGRDRMCYEVLNDEWVSYPTWASEDGGFVSHKKNQFEEALHKCEEERYEYDMFIEANMHTIALLEPIGKKLAKMSGEERARFKLEPGLGGRSLIYQRVIKKVYEGDKCIEVLEALHNNPAMAVPVVLKRLKQKDEEWKRAQREWNKIWREIDAKNYYKSLDHQGITFKTDDKRTLSTKTLLSEIEALRREPKDDVEQTDYQYKFIFNDIDVFKDAAHVVFSYMDRQSTLAQVERDKIEQFLKSFVTSFFDLPATFFDGLHDESDMIIDNDDMVDNRSVENVENGSLSSEPISGMWIQMSKESREDIKAVVSKAGIGKPKKQSTCFFGNDHFYCFFRFLQILFSRLEQMKTSPPHSSPNSKGQTSAAAELGVRDIRHDADDTDDTGEPYLVLLELVDKLFEQEYDSMEFEDRLRQIYGTKAYIMFTVDRLAQNLVKQMHHIVTDPKSSNLISLFDKNKQQQNEQSRSRIMYQLHANSSIGYEEHTYRIDYHKNEKAMTITLSGRDCSLGEAVSSEEKWAYYMYSYMSLNPTEGVSKQSKRPFLNRNLPSVDISEPITTNVLTRNGLEIKICINSYHVFFVNNTEDSFKRPQPPLDPEKLQQDRARRQERWNEWFKAREGEYGTEATDE